MLCRLKNGRECEESYTVGEDGVSITAHGDREVGYALPLLEFDGEKQTKISVEGSSLTVEYEGWICRYDTNGTVVNLNRTVVNRNGYYRAFFVTAERDISVQITIKKA